MYCDSISNTVIARLPIYLHYLNSLGDDGKNTISSAAIAQALDMGEVQVRKDLALVSGAGKPKIGYVVSELTKHIETALGMGKERKAIIVGAGKLGRALLGYEGFNEYGLNIIAAFDKKSTEREITANNKFVYPISELKGFCTDNDIGIGIITVPEAEAQKVCDELTECGISAIWNFSPVKLKISGDVKLKNENMAASLAALVAKM